MTFKPGDNVVIHADGKQELGWFVKKAATADGMSFVSCNSNIRAVDNKCISKTEYGKDDEVIVHRLGLPDTTGKVVNPIPNKFGCVEVNWLDNALTDNVELRRVGRIHINNLSKVGNNFTKLDGKDNDNPNVTFKREKESTYIPYSARTDKSKAFVK